METINVTIRLDKETVAFLDELAVHDERDRSYVIRRAIRNFVEMQQWQLEEIRKAIKEADAGDFLSDAETKAFMDELGK
jgi:RHH-type transcriptional regulator, rel operon repressor / antitoxin RelB